MKFSTSASNRNSARMVKQGVFGTLSATPLLVAMMSAGATSAFAADAAQTAQAPAVEEIVVTGSRVVRDGYQAPTPVSVIGVEALANTATSNLADTINQLPVLQGSTTPATTATLTTSGLGAINGLNLRGLGTSRTLVLLNGQRTVGSILTGVVDVSELPQHLIERVETVTGGASAAYGSDAMTGVVNFILNTTFVGFKGEVSGGVTTYGDDRNWKVNAAYGTAFANGRGHFIISSEAAVDDGLIINTRDWNKQGYSYINNPTYTATNGQPRVLQTSRVGLGPVASWGGTIAQGPLRGVSFGPGGGIYSLALGDIVQDPLMRGGSWESQQVSPVRGAALLPRQNRQDIFTRAQIDINDDIQVYAQGGWAHLNSYSSGAPNFFPGNLVLKTDNAFLPESLRPALVAAGGAAQTFTFGTMNMDLDNFRALYDRRVLRFLVGADGRFNAMDTDWKWDSYLSIGQMFGSLVSLHAMDQPRYRQAVDAVRAPNGSIVCRSTLTNPTDGCVPYNVFGIGVNSAAAVNYIQGRNGWANQRLLQKVAAVNLHGDPFSTWAGPVSVAAGYEHREEKMRMTTDPEEQANPGIWFQGAGQPYTGKVVVNDLYAEAVVPLAKDTVWAKSFDLNAAFRATNYSTYGWVGTWKLGATYNPIDDIRFRATRSRNIRSPTLVDLYAAGTSQNNALVDPFNGGATVNYTSRASGNPNLKAEKSDDTGLGVVLQPQFFPGFSVSFDYYHIDISDAVNTPTVDQLVNLCFQGNQSACSAITRTGTGASTFLLIKVVPQNFATEKARGFDIEASYAVPLSSINDSWDGRLGARVLATHYTSYIIDSGLPGLPAIQYAGYVSGRGVPSWRVQGNLTYALDPINVGLTFRHISASGNIATQIECASGCPTSTGTNVTVDNNHVSGAFYTDLNLGYKIHAGETGQAELFLNVRNITNADPVIVPSGPGGTSYDFPPTAVGVYDVLGRVFRAGVRFKM
jgi:iron complex outermembrane receptor protein